jgi:glycerophosphoryl diester phosphodiesterase
MADELARPTIYAHRGARAHAPENTLLAFRLGYALGADAFECDVQLTADGALVVIHDDKLNRTTTGKGTVAARSLGELRELDAGRGERIPTLAEVLACAQAWGRGVNLELKAETEEAARATARAIEPVLAATDACRRPQVLVSSFELGALPDLKRRLPWLRIGTLHGGRQWRRRDMMAPALAMGAEAIHPSTQLVSADLVRRAHGHGLQVNVWTANRWSTLRSLLELGVDGVFTDYPERAVISRMLKGQVSEPPDQAQDDAAEE